MFLRKTAIGREPLALTMTGVRMGERVLQIGAVDVRLAALLAAKQGMSGEAAIVTADAATGLLQLGWKRCRRSVLLRE